MTILADFHIKQHSNKKQKKNNKKHTKTYLEIDKLKLPPKKLISCSKNTVKPELTSTSEQRPPVYQGHRFKGPIKICIIQDTSEQRPPVNNGHNFRVPRVVVVHRLDCRFNFFLKILGKKNKKTIFYNSKMSNIC